jgi:hypothetical protein
MGNVLQAAQAGAAAAHSQAAQAVRGLQSLTASSVFVGAVGSVGANDPSKDEDDDHVFGAVVVACILWQVFCFTSVARYLFPNFWYERGLVSSLHAHTLIQIYTNTDYCLAAFCTWILTTKP